MIIIESATKGNGLLAVVRLPGDSLTETTPPNSITAYTSRDPIVNCTLPFSVVLPFVTPSNVWFPVGMSAFGPSAGCLEVGRLWSIDSKSREPKPCTHSTMRGTLLPSTNGIPVITCWTNRSEHTGSSIRYSKSGAIRKFEYGRPATTSFRLAYNKDAEKVPCIISASVPYLWSTSSCYDDGPSQDARSVAGFTATTASNIEDVCWYDRKPNPIMGEATMMTYRVITHIAKSKWQELWITEYYHNAGYVPAEPCSKYTGFGYVVASLTRKRTYTMTNIQSTHATAFGAILDVDEHLEWWGHKSTPFLAERFSGSCDNRYAVKAPILIVEPGRAPSTDVKSPLFDALCEEYADLHYLSRAETYATSARESAYADESGLTSNWIENLSQIGSTGSIFQCLVDGYRCATTGNLVYAKDALRNAYLSYSYAIRPSLKDIKELKAKKDVFKTITAPNASEERRRGQARCAALVRDCPATQVYSCTLRLIPKSNVFGQLLGKLESLGLDPSAGNAWDCVPLSFVADWFVSTGDALKSISSYNNVFYAKDIRARVESFDSKFTIPVQDFSRLGISEADVIVPLESVWYNREVFGSYGDISPSFFDTTSGLTPSQMLQGVALTL